MIKATELRIGNLVYANEHGDNIYEIVGVWCDDIYTRSGGNFGDGERWHYESVEPIPITPGILEKCGFEKTDMCYSYYEDKKFISAAHDCTRFIMGIDDEVRQTVFAESVIIKYLHRLQNLYFALTGAELTVNL